MFEKIKNFFKGVKKPVANQTITKSKLEEALGVEIAVSDKMQTAINEWYDGYINHWPWIDKETKGRNIAAIISSEMARLVMTDFAVTFEGDGERYKALETFHRENIYENLRTWLEYSVALGGGVFKPFITEKNNIGVNFIRAGEFYPTHYAPSGKIEGAIFPTKNVQGKDVYYLIEHQYIHEENLIIEHKAFKAKMGLTGEETKLEPVPLNILPEWSVLQPKIMIQGRNRPLFTYFKMPLANNIDLDSPLGASVFARAKSLIKDLDIIYENYNWEFESGKRAIYTADIAFERDKQTGELIIPNKRLYRTLRQRGVEQSNKLFEDFSPTFREAELSSGMNAILMAIEDSCGLARGSFSLLDFTVAKTATELKISQQRSYQTVGNIQDELKNTLETLYECVSFLCDYYRQDTDASGKYSAVFNFGDSVMDDRTKEFTERMQMVTAGLLPKWNLVAWYLGVDEETAKEIVKSSDSNTPLFKDEE